MLAWVAVASKISFDGHVAQVAPSDVLLGSPLRANAPMLAIIAAGFVTAFLWPSAWPDLLVGLGIAALNADAAREVWQTARAEHRTAQP